MAYDPFRRGRFPAGVRTVQLTDAARDGRSLPVEVWYPAAARHAGEDLNERTRDAYTLIPGFPAMPQDAVRDAAPAPGRFPLVAFSHGYAGHRRQSTFLATHLASHGYVVVAADHTGNTVLDTVEAMLGGRRPDPPAVLRAFVVARPADVTFVLDRVLGGAAGEIGDLVDPDRIGMSGHSFGGWTTLAVTARDTRIRAALALAPAGGGSPVGAEVLGAALDLGWRRDVPTLFVVADQDNVLPLAGMHDLFARTRATKRMVVLRDADHIHFCDDVERAHEMFRTVPGDPLFEPIRARMRPIEQLAPGRHAHDVVRGLGLAHLDATLKGDAPAGRFLAGDLGAVMAARGVRVDVTPTDGAPRPR